MFAFAYNSRAAIPFDEEALERLAMRSQERNRSLGVTGYLYFRDGRFLQYLEGDEPEVRALMRRIENDSRHCITTSFELGEIKERLFPAWAMRYIGPDLKRAPSATVEDELRNLIVHASEEDQPAESATPAVLQVTRRIARLDW